MNGVEQLDINDSELEKYGWRECIECVNKIIATSIVCIFPRVLLPIAHVAFSLYFIVVVQIGVSFSLNTLFVRTVRDTIIKIKMKKKIIEKRSPLWCVHV